MMNFQPELVKLASEEQRNRLMAEAAQWRMLQASQANGSQSKHRAVSWLRQRLVSLWRWLLPTSANQRPPQWFRPDFSQ